MNRTNLDFRQFLIITLLTSIWINISEVFRYFILVMPRMKAFFGYRTGIAEMDWLIFSIWGAWDLLLTTILVFTWWLYAEKFGNTTRSALASGTLVWGAVFVIFWVAAANMGLSSWGLLGITLPLSWLEMVVGAWLAGRIHASRSNHLGRASA